MNRVVSLLIILALVLCGCSAKEPAGVSAPVTTQPQTTEATQEPTIPGDQMLAFAEDDSCYIGIAQLVSGGPMGLTLELWLENRSAEQTYLFTVEQADVNGLLLQSHFAATMEPDTIGQETLFFLENGQREPGKPTRIGLHFQVMEADSLETVSEHTLTLFPNGEDQVTLYERQEQPSDIVLASYEKVQIRQIDKSDNGSLELFFCNEGDEPVLILVEQEEEPAETETQPATEETETQPATEETTQPTTQDPSQPSTEDGAEQMWAQNRTVLLSVLLPAHTCAYRTVTPETAMPLAVRGFHPEGMQELFDQRDILP